MTSTDVFGDRAMQVIPVGETHYVGNLGVIAFTCIEVQSGCSLGKNGTVRFEDRYGRA
jgi:mannose-6-phosphate isomerase-like protein (cupin superfamily)